MFFETVALMPVTVPPADDRGYGRRRRGRYARVRQRRGIDPGRGGTLEIDVHEQDRRRAGSQGHQRGLGERDAVVDIPVCPQLDAPLA